jgi:hypothetical protein
VFKYVWSALLLIVEDTDSPIVILPSTLLVTNPCVSLNVALKGYVPSAKSTSEYIS